LLHQAILAYDLYSVVLLISAVLLTDQISFKKTHFFFIDCCYRMEAEIPLLHGNPRRWHRRPWYRWI